MSEIHDIPEVKDASGIFKFDGNKKAILVPLDCLDGVGKLWEDYAKETGVTILPYNRCETSIEDWEELCKRLHYVIAYFIHANDLSTSEAEEEICFAMDKFAKGNNLPVHDWSADYEEKYGDSQGSED